MRASISLLTPEKMITANVDSIPPGWRASKYMDFKTRKGKYRLNDKATERKLKKAANFHDIKVDDMKGDSSHSIQFSTGSYLTTVVPLLETFKGLVGTDVVSEGKNGEEIKIDVDKVEDKTDLSNTMVEHIIRLRVGGDDVVVTMYDTTLRMRIQGTGEQVKYTTQVLIPYLEDQVDKNTKASKEFNCECFQAKSLRRFRVATGANSWRGAFIKLDDILLIMAGGKSFLEREFGGDSLQESESYIIF